MNASEPLKPGPKKSGGSTKKTDWECNATHAQRYSSTMDECEGAAVCGQNDGAGTKRGSGEHFRKRIADRRNRESDERNVSRKRTRSGEYEKFEMEDGSPEIFGDQPEREATADDHSLGDAAVLVASIPSLRERSRQDYLLKRALQRIDLLKQEIADDEALFRGTKISLSEKRVLEHKKEVLRLAEEGMKVDHSLDGYWFPDDIKEGKKEMVPYRRHRKNLYEDDWETRQMKRSVMDEVQTTEQYGYVFDESQAIQFVVDDVAKREEDIFPDNRRRQPLIEEAGKKGELRFTISFSCH